MRRKIERSVACRPCSRRTQCAGCSTMFPTKLREFLAQTEGKATVGRRHLGQPFGEDAPGTALLITVELPDVQLQDDLDVSPLTGPRLCERLDYGSDEP